MMEPAFDVASVLQAGLSAVQPLCDEKLSKTVKRRSRIKRNAVLKSKEASCAINSFLWSGLEKASAGRAGNKDVAEGVSFDTSFAWSDCAQQFKTMSLQISSLEFKLDVLMGNIGLWAAPNRTFFPEALSEAQGAVPAEVLRKQCHAVRVIQKAWRRNQTKRRATKATGGSATLQRNVLLRMRIPSEAVPQELRGLRITDDDFVLPCQICHNLECVCEEFAHWRPSSKNQFAMNGSPEHAELQVEAASILQCFFRERYARNNNMVDSDLSQIYLPLSEWRLATGLVNLPSDILLSTYGGEKSGQRDYDTNLWIKIREDTDDIRDAGINPGDIKSWFVKVLRKFDHQLASSETINERIRTVFLEWSDFRLSVPAEARPNLAHGVFDHINVLRRTASSLE